MSTKRIQHGHPHYIPFFWKANFSLVCIDISVDTIVTYRYFSDRHFIDLTIVHIFHDDIIICDICDDTDVTVVAIISTSRELDDRTRNRFLSCFYSCGFRIFHPGIRISSPAYTLILCNIPGTVSPCKSTREPSILHRIARLKTCRYIYCSRTTRWLCSRYRLNSCSCCFWSICFFCIDEFSRSTRNHEIHTLADRRSITESVDTDDIICIDTIEPGNLRNSISGSDGMYYSRNGRDTER